MKYNDRRKYYWDASILLFALFNTLTIPLVLSFEEIAVYAGHNRVYIIFNNIGTVFFIADIVLNFSTTYLNPIGEEIFDRKKIAINYLKGSFVVDLLSSLPIEYIAPKSKLRLLNILKLLRITRLTKVINESQISDENKSICRILQVFLLLFIFMHAIACLQNPLVSSFNEELWVMPVFYVHAGDKDLIYMFYSKSDVEKYAFLLYNSILYIGGNEMGPATTFQIFVSCTILLFASCFLSWLFGEMAVLVELYGIDENKQ